MGGTSCHWISAVQLKMLWEMDGSRRANSSIFLFNVKSTGVAQTGHSETDDGQLPKEPSSIFSLRVWFLVAQRVQLWSCESSRSEGWAFIDECTALVRVGPVVING
jgi:hypothetical protein